MAIPEEEIDDRGYMGRTCFVVMPFGLKIDTGKLAAVAVEASSAGMETVQLLPGADVPVIDFDATDRKVIEPAVEKAAKNVGLEIECIRSDKAGHSGFIHREMLEHVAGADIAIVDITTQNANVFYELGVRHSFRRSTTILIQRLGTHIPFNISGMRVLPYSDNEVPDENGNSRLQTSVQKLADMIAASTRQKESMSK